MYYPAGPRRGLLLASRRQEEMRVGLAAPIPYGAHGNEEQDHSGQRHRPGVRPGAPLPQRGVLHIEEGREQRHAAVRAGGEPWTLRGVGQACFELRHGLRARSCFQLVPRCICPDWPDSKKQGQRDEGQRQAVPQHGRSVIGADEGRQGPDRPPAPRQGSRLRARSRPTSVGSLR